MTNTLENLINQLNHHDHHVRSSAISALHQLDDDRKYDVLVNALHTEPDIFITEDITWALVKHTDATIDRVMTLVTHPNPTARHRAVHTLGKMGKPQALDALIPALQDKDKSVMMKCIFVLGQIGDSRAIPALIGLLGSDDVDIEGVLMEVIEKFGKPALPHLMQALQHEHWRVREQATTILGQIGDSSAVPALITALNDPHWSVRFEAIQALAGIDKKHLKQVIQPLQNDPDSRVRALANKLVK